jgi:hypothetical protein
VAELIAAFWAHAKSYYRRPDGSATSELGVYKQLLRFVRQRYGRTPVSEFGPLSLKALRAQMVQRGWCRRRRLHIRSKLPRYC